MMLLESSEARQKIAGRQFEHLKNILKAGIGSQCKVGIRKGRIGRATVIAMNSDSAEIDIELDRDPPPKQHIMLALALPRPQTLKKTLHAAATMGVEHLALFHSFKVEKSYWQSPCLEPDFLDREMVLALEQCADTVPMRISMHRKFRSFIEQELPLLASDRRRLVAHPAASGPCPAIDACGVCLALGPEGGFTDSEYASFVDAGFTGITLGERILRTEVALPALLTLCKL